jgi:hypothetical protein
LVGAAVLIDIVDIVSSVRAAPASNEECVLPGGGSLYHKAARVRTTRSNLESNRAGAARAVALVTLAIAAAIDPQVHAAAGEVNRDVRARFARDRLKGCRVIGEFELVIAWIVHVR